jgi:electron transfer flavoprotein beta subunit
MPELHIVACTKVVPKPEEIRVDEATLRIDRGQVRSEINPPDMNALEMALRLKDLHGGRLSIISMGPPLFEPYLRVALAMGADQVFLLSDPKFGGADTLATTYTLAQAIRKIGDVDLIICGEESSDGATGQVPPGLAEWLDMPQLTLTTQVDVNPKSRVAIGKRGIPGGFELLQVPLPAVVSVKTAANEPRFMDFEIKPWAFDEAKVTVWGSADLDVDADKIGEPGSPTIVSGLAEAEVRERKRIFLEGSPDEMARRLAQILSEQI